MPRSLSKSSGIPPACAGSRSLTVKAHSSVASLSCLLWARMHLSGAPHVQVYGLSGPVARYIGRNGPILHRFANEDVTLGAWLVGLEVTHVDERRFCCDSAERCMAQASACPNLLLEAASHRVTLEPCVPELPLTGILSAGMRNLALPVHRTS